MKQEHISREYWEEAINLWKKFKMSFYLMLL